MIGLGSNRLTVCRRGGMSVTQAGKGGMEWLAGGRMPSWASPYSAQATAALKAQFPTQWPTIRDYGFAHPEIVGYMNAYAPEDAKIAYSLVPTLNVVRTLVNNGVAYLNTGITPRSNTGFKAIIEPNISVYNGYSISAGNRDDRYAIYDQGGVIIYWYYSNGYASSGVSYNKPLYIEYNIDGKFYIKDLDGNILFQRNLSQRDCTGPLITGIPTGTSYSIEKDKKRFIIIETNGIEDWHGIPFIRKINNVEHYGMIDLVSGNFFEDATGNNGFTISETPAS